MTDYRDCRLSFAGGENELAGPPDALRDLCRLLRADPEAIEVPVRGGTVAQARTAGPLLVGVRDGNVLCLSGGVEYLDIVWDALDGLAEQSETAEDRAIHRHQHIEYYPGDEYRSPDSVPLIIVADWPDESGPC
ncbi:hypothetical protein QEZ54_11045 [Catellatospora sp. KI3]|uniref:Imm32 family immunity protein n=1 Tax=Catellatospora sp. KI3 TaxID=3041620 RepID=UPI002482A531|nr:hypothetical protein [Catellatospora sp. KI3]MDI1461508.1 hypothetical protein [Catellatospora sp. KI3]